jgi:hypothetical protein
MKKKATAMIEMMPMMQLRPSAVIWLAIVLAAVTVTARAAPDAPAELPPPAAKATTETDSKAGSKTDATSDGPAKKKPAPSDGRCDRCDGCVCVHRVCVAKRTEKEIIKVCWSYKCEDFCIPGPSIYCGEKCLHDTCGCWTHSIWKPTCAEVRTKRVPVKNVVKRKVPGVEWKVEERCKECRFLCVGIDEPKKLTESDQRVAGKEQDDDSQGDSGHKKP